MIFSKFLQPTKQALKEQNLIWLIIKNHPKVTNNLGNHEFDNGIDNLVKYLNNANTPTVCSNFNFTSEPRLKIPSLTPSYVKTVDGKKIAFIGYLTPDTMSTSFTENLEIYSEIPSIRAEAARLKAAGANIIIGLGHSGIEKDLKIAEEIEEINLIVGGHSHTFQYTPPEKSPSTEKTIFPYPTWVTQKSGKKVPIVQAYAYTKYLGKLLVTFDETGNVKSAIGNPILLNAEIKKEPNMLEAVSVWAKKILDTLRVVKGYTRTFLSKSNFVNGIFECTMANLITDALVDLGVTYSATKKINTWTIAPIALYQNGGIRTEINNKRNYGALTLEDLMTILPFSNQITLVTLRGKTIREVLETNVKSYNQETSYLTAPYYVHFSGMRVEYDLNKPVGSRVKHVEVVCSQCDIPKFVPLEDEIAYQVLTVEYLAKGGDKYDMIPAGLLNFTVLEWVDYETLAIYIEKNKFIYPKLDNRIVVKGFNKNRKSYYSASNAVSVSNLIIILCALFTYFFGIN